MKDEQINFTDYQELPGGTLLPTINGYTVDMRCKEFRLITYGSMTEWEVIDFDSKRGRRLLLKLALVVVPESRLWKELFGICFEF